MSSVSSRSDPYAASNSGLAGWYSSGFAPRNALLKPLRVSSPTIPR